MSDPMPTQNVAPIPANHDEVDAPAAAAKPTRRSVPVAQSNKEHCDAQATPMLRALVLIFTVLVTDITVV